MPGDEGVPAVDHRRRRRRVAIVGAFLVGVVLLLWYEAGQTPHRVCGDAWEYWYQAESLHRHGSPELWAEDVAAVNDEAKRLELEKPPPDPYAYMTAPDGQMFSMHFWTYGLSTVPAKMYLRQVGGCELTAPELTNAAWFLLALTVTVFGSSAPLAQRLALATLAGLGPVLWYLPWQGAEVFSWALGLIAVVAYRDQRYAVAGWAVGLAATQNPPLAFLGAAAVLGAAWDRRWRSAALATLGTALVFVPFAFYQYHFGKPNLISGGEEYVGVRNFSLVRTWGQFTDFNHGLLPYAPVLVIGMVAGAIRLAYTRNVRGLILLGGAVGVALSVQVAHNWNSADYGLQRYLVWILPLAAGVTVEGLAGTRRALVRLAAVAALIHGILLFAHPRLDTFKDGYLSHTPLSNWMLTNYPRAYWIEPEVFIERTRHRDGWPYFGADYPIVHVAPDGTVTKLLVDAAGVERIEKRFEVDPGYLLELRERTAGESGPFYAHPPAGAVRSRER